MSRRANRPGTPLANLPTAGWWTASLRARPILDLLRRWSGPLAWASAGLALNGCAEILSADPPETEADAAQAALDAQQTYGWQVGSDDRPLVFPSARDTDAAGTTRWRDFMPTLSLQLGPSHSRWLPYYNPTLFQSLEAPRNADLRMAMRPIFMPGMALANRRGQALLAALREGGTCRTDVAVVLDLSGPEAVAVAAALSPCFDPVFVFANWPHPQGVVPSHQTLGAALYFLPDFARARPVRSGAAAPVLVLDRQRMAAYTDEATQFDNRYFAGLPPPDAFAAAGIRHVLYVTPDDQVTLESDDLNEALADIDEHRIDVRMLALSDFAESPLPGWAEVQPCPSSTALLEPEPPAAPGTAPPLYFGGSAAAESCFSFWYGWRTESEPTLEGFSSSVSVSPALSLSLPPRLGARCHYRPARRASAMALGHLHGSPPGHGWRGAPPATGAPHFGGWFGRSGSLGRFHSSGSG